MKTNCVITRSSISVIPAKAGIQSLDPRHIFGEERQVLPEKCSAHWARALKHSGMTLHVRLLRRTDRPAPEDQAAVRRSNNRRRPYGLLAMMAYIFILNIVDIQLLYSSEVITDTHSKVIVREHPKTGKPYVAVAPGNLADGTGFFPESKKFSRPDYRLLDPKVKSGEIPYDGPYSDSKRIYIFAASLATLGAGGLVGAAMMPATGAAAATGGTGYLAVGGALAAGTAATATTSLRSNPKKDNYVQASESQSIYKEQSSKDRPST